MQYSRAQRRHHNERLMRKRFKEELRFQSARDDKPWALIRARHRLNTSCLCSCTMCASPRRLYGNGKGGKTFQELRTPIEFDYE